MMMDMIYTGDFRVLECIAVLVCARGWVGILIHVMFFPGESALTRLNSSTCDAMWALLLL
jgi:hypothetical protein